MSPARGCGVSVGVNVISKVGVAEGVNVKMTGVVKVRVMIGVKDTAKGLVFVEVDKGAGGFAAVPPLKLLQMR